MNTRVAVAAITLVALSGCAVATLKHQAAVDHGCTEDRVAVVRASDDSAVPTEVNVCGKARRYRVTGTDQMGMPVWMDVTDLIPASSAAPAGN